MRKSLRLVFFGSGPVALSNLKALHDHFDIELVVTKPAKGHEKNPPVLNWALQNQLPIITPSDSAELNKQFGNLELKSKLGVVVDFGMIISSTVINRFALGIINSHFSLLPKLRGADPITFAILEGHDTTGVSLMKIVPKLDEGDLLLQREFPLNQQITAPQLTDALSQLSAELLIGTLPKYAAGEMKLYGQDDTVKPTYTRKLTKTDSVVDWSKPAVLIERQVRAFVDWPKTRAEIGKTRVSLLKAIVVNGSGQPGQFYKTSSGELAVYCGQGSLVIEELMPDARKPMSGRAFLNGYSLG